MQENHCCSLISYWTSDRLRHKPAFSQVADLKNKKRTSSHFPNFLPNFISFSFFPACSRRASPRLWLAASLPRNESLAPRSPWSRWKYARLDQHAPSYEGSCIIGRDESTNYSFCCETDKCKRNSLALGRYIHRARDVGRSRACRPPRQTKGHR